MSTPEPLPPNAISFQEGLAQMASLMEQLSPDEASLLQQEFVRLMPVGARWRLVSLLLDTNENLMVAWAFRQAIKSVAQLPSYEKARTAIQSYLNLMTGQ
jgi:hypothetical protein